MAKITTPANVPAIETVVRFWSYRTFFAARPSGARLIYQHGFTSAHDDPFQVLRRELSAITSPDEFKLNHIDNHSGWEVRLRNGQRAFALYSDLCFYVYTLPEETT